MTKFYTNVAQHGNNILYRGVKEGRRVKMKIAYAPTLFVPVKKPTDYKTLFGDYVEPVKFENIREAKNFIEQYKDVSNFKIYGNQAHTYSFIAEEFKGMIDWNINDISVAVIDIEVGSENGFPDPYQANEPITAICIRFMGGKTHVFGCEPYVKNSDDVIYYQCGVEQNLCKQFLDFWQENCPDVISGWNINFFDVPYLVNRFRRLLGDDMTNRLSPWGRIDEREVNVMNKKNISYTMVGVSALDYIDLYKWYAPGGKSQESYRLDHIANVEIDESKLSYDEFDNLNQLYRLDFQKFIDYNIKDVDLIFKLENKLKLIELGLTLAYDTKCNFNDIFAQTRMWDSLINNYLLERKIVIPPKEISSKTERFEGAYVKEPQIGLHNWVASFDLNSLYPHLLMQYNISPETLVEPSDYTHEMLQVLSQGVTVDNLLVKKLDTSGLNNVTLTPNSQFFRTNKQGFLPAMMEELYEDRKKFKKLMLKAKQEYENEKDPVKKNEIQNLVSRYDNLQLAKKLSLNSAYGALGSQYFRFYDLRMALAVTLAGQLSIRWIENKLNNYMNNLLKTNEDYVIASDTDSIYLRLGPLVEKVFGVGGKVSQPASKTIEFMDKVCEDKLQPFIDSSYQELATYMRSFAQKMQMKREALADKGIWTAKKRYILNVYNNEGVQYNEPKLKVMGLEMVKSSTPAAIREKMRLSIKIMVQGTEEDIHKFIADFKIAFKKLPPEDISFPRGLNGLKEYSDPVMLYKKGTPIHVKGAILYNDKLKKMNLDKKYQLIQEGEKLKFTYLKQPNPLKDSVLSFPTRIPKEFELEQYVDYDMQFNKAFLEPIKIILDCMGWQTEKPNTLESFFG